MDIDALNLSGAWHGLYSYPIGRPPVPFEVALIETNSWISGVTHETGTTGDTRGLTLSATLQGRRVGRSITFLKLYDGFSRRYDGVHYTGDVNGDGTEIEGRWTIPGNWSGKFLMIRDGSDAAVLVREVTEQV